MILVNMKYGDCRLGGMWLSVGGFRSWRVLESEGLRGLESMSWGSVVSCWLLVFWVERLLIASCWLLVRSN
ncbi:hypothetical protein IW22_22285 [Chryseobacterium sp. JM1]|nr:hypothetical protein IW22_22285 [Chryseobacterium sp. JM1]